MTNFANFDLDEKVAIVTGASRGVGVDGSPRLRRHLEIVAAYLLCLAGLLGYVLFAPLITWVRAGLLYNEWLLYLWLALLAVGLPLYASFRLKQSPLGIAAGLIVSSLALLLGVYVGAVFTATPLWSMALLGYGMTLFSLYAMLMLVATLRLGRAWFGGTVDRWASVAMAGLLLLMIISWGGLGWKQTLNPPAGPVQLFFWGRWDALKLPDKVLTDLQDVNATMYIFIGEKSLDDGVRDKFRRAMERYAEYNVEVVLTIILNSHDGFISVVNYGEYISYTERLLDFVGVADLSAIVGVIADAEPPFSIVDPWQKETAQEWIFKENGRYRRWDVAQYERALDAFSTYIDRFDQLHPGLSVMVSTIQPATFDALDGDADISIAYKFAAYPPTNWDTVNVQIYSSHHAAQSAPYFTWQGVKLSQHVVEGGPLSVSVGIIGEGSMQGEAGFRRLVNDIHLCRALGVQEIIVFSLGRGLESFGPDFVTRLNQAVNAPAVLEIGFSRAAAVVPYGAGVWDAVLDLRGTRGLAVWGWCGLVLTWRVWRRSIPNRLFLCHI